MVKTMYLSVIATVLLIGVSCNNSTESEKKCLASYEFLPQNFKDTVNLVDCNGWKQGKWVPSPTNKQKDTMYYRNDTLVQ